jgi:hypothetical protein
LAATLSVLLVEDSEEDALLVVRELRRAGHDVRHERVETREGMEAALRDGTWDLVITDNAMPRFSADEAIRLLGDTGMDIPVLVVSGTMSESHAVDAMRAGARDFIVKGNISRLVPAVEREVREAESRRARLRAEEALRRASERQGLILSQLPLVLYSAKAPATLWISDNSEAVTGFPPFAFLGKGFLWRERMHPEDREGVLARFEEGKESKSVSCEYRWQRADGQWRWFLDHAVLADGEGGVSGAFNGLFLDISERRKLEEDFRQAQKMEAVGRLAGGVAHDFNNMLTVMGGYAQLALDRIPEDHPVHQSLTEITRAASKAADITRQLLAFSRRQVLKPRPTNLNDVVSEMGTLLRRLLGEDVEMRMTLDPLLATVDVDPSQMQQVLMNLAINARDAMPEGGRLTIETTNAVLTETYAEQRPQVGAGEYVLLAVTDTGHGMDEETRSHVFEPFFTTKEQGKGTGLGLATVYGIVKQSGGFIWVYSEPGHGACFKVYLPRIGVPAEREVRVEQRPVVGGTETILVVEDEEAVRRFVCETLAALGYAVLEAQELSAVDGVLDRHRGPLHLLLTDVVLPGGSGRKVSESVMARFPEVAVLFMSGYTEDAIHHGGRLDPGVRFIEKPFSPVSLAARVREVLDSTPPGSPT